MTSTLLKKLLTSAVRGVGRRKGGVYMRINEHFEPSNNEAMCRQGAFQQPARAARYKAIGITLWLTVATTTFADDLLVGASGDKTAESTRSTQLIAALSSRGAQLSEVRGTFKQTKKILGLPIELNSHGAFHFLSNEGMQWHTTSPIDSQVTVSAAGINNTDAPVAETSTHSAMLGQLILAVFSGDLTALQRHFLATASGELTDWSILLTPASVTVAQQFTEIKVTGSEFTESVHLLEKNGDETRISLTVDDLNTRND